MRACRFLSALLLAALLCACGGGGGEPPPATGTVAIGGTLSGLGEGRSVVLAHVEPDGAVPQSATLTANGRYSLAVPVGTAYDLRVLAQPAGQTCTVENGTGTASVDVDDIVVACRDDAPQGVAVEGTLDGLAPGASLVLRLEAASGAQELALSANGAFRFDQPVSVPYVVTVRSQPAGQTCAVDTSGALSVQCAATLFTLGGSLAGSTGSLTLRNAANGDTLTLGADGTFTFAQPVASGATYDVVMQLSPGQTCSVANGTGTATADVTTVAVACVPDVAAVPDAPAGLTLGYGVKSFNLAWSAVAEPADGGPVVYRVFEDLDGAGPQAGVQVGGDLSATAYSRVVAGLLQTRLQARYAVRACNDAGCSAASTFAAPDVTRAIGYFKASNTGASDQFGHAIVLSADGSTLAVGAVGEASNAQGVNGDQADDGAMFAGAVYVFVRTPGGAWSQQAYLKASNADGFDFFGYSLALSADGHTLVVGAYGEASAATGVDGAQGDNSATNAGAAYVFTRTGAAWTQQAYLKASNAEAGDFFGMAVALSGDGATLAVGAIGESSAAGPGDNSASGAGATYVFVRDGVTWSEQAYLKATNAGPGDGFGFALALSQDGSTLAGGASTEASNATGVEGNGANDSMPRAGAAYVFRRAGVAWAQQAYLKASNTRAHAEFGSAIALSADGGTLAVGSRSENSSATGVNGDGAIVGAAGAGAGAVYVFVHDGANWGQQAYLKASRALPSAWFGTAIGLSANGHALAVGSRLEPGGATGIDGDPSAAGGTNAGAAYLFVRSGAVWSQQRYLKASNTGDFDQFGAALALSADGSTLAVGAAAEAGASTGIGGDQASDAATWAGAVYLY